MGIGTTIRTIRKSKGLSQIEVAQQAKIAINSLRLYESEKRQPRLEVIYRIAVALDVRIEDLIGLETFDSGADFERRRNEVLSERSDNPHAVESITIIHKMAPQLRLQSAFEQLNEKGQEVAAERVEELTKISDYRIKDGDPHGDN